MYNSHRSENDFPDGATQPRGDPRTAGYNDRRARSRTMVPTHNASSSVTRGASASEAIRPTAGGRVCPSTAATDGGVLFAASSAVRDSAMGSRIAVSASLLVATRFILAPPSACRDRSGAPPAEDEANVRVSGRGRRAERQRKQPATSRQRPRPPEGSKASATPSR